MSGCTVDTHAPYTMPTTASAKIHGAKSTLASGKRGRQNRRNPYVPIFRSTPARMTEPAVGASTCASGSHVWNGNIGTLIANASANARNSSVCDRPGGITHRTTVGRSNVKTPVAAPCW